MNSCPGGTRSTIRGRSGSVPLCMGVLLGSSTDQRAVFHVFRFPDRILNRAHFSGTSRRLSDHIDRGHDESSLNAWMGRNRKMYGSYLTQPIDSRRRYAAGGQASFHRFGPHDRRTCSERRHRGGRLPLTATTALLTEVSASLFRWPAHSMLTRSLRCSACAGFGRNHGLPCQTAEIFGLRWKCWRIG